MKKSIYFIFTFLIFYNTNSQIVNTQFGQIQGNTNGTIHEFLGIPFAKPPIANLRWKAPQNPDSWTTVLSTASFSPICPQKKFDQGGTNYTLEGNEDCLYLNIWTPQLITPNLPVLVFIHGGGNQQGGASEINGGTQMYFGKNMSERGNAVIVTIQYRLGPLGFLVHPGLNIENSNSISGNYAVLDQILALQWIQNNISNFGGDNTKVMIFGESAGGVNVGNLLNTTLANGLFQRACIESAVPIIESYSNSETNGTSFVDSYISTGTNTEKINYMRTLSSDELIINEMPPVSGGAVQAIWKANVDNFIFNNYPAQNFQSGNYNKVPLIIGSNSEEMSLSAPTTVTPALVNLLINSIVPSALQPQAHNLYPNGTSNAEAKNSYIGVLTDSQFTSTTRRVAQCVSKNQIEPVWRYFFSYKHSIPALENLGSYHGMELFYVFNNWENATLGSGNLFSANDGIVQDLMLDYWVNFAKTGNPNEVGLTNWPQYNDVSDCYIEINENPNGNQCGLRTQKSDLWDAVVSFVPCTSSLSTNIVSEVKNELKIYPNPIDKNATIELNNLEKITSIELYDNVGKLILNFNNINSKIFHFENNEIQSGIYILKIIDSKNNFYFEKIVLK